MRNRFPYHVLSVLFFTICIFNINFRIANFANIIQEDEIVGRNVKRPSPLEAVEEVNYLSLYYFFSLKA